MQSFPAKVLLFGEHTVLYGGRALAVPFERFSAKWVRRESADQRLLDLGDYLRKSKEKRNWLSVDQFIEDISNGWQLDSNVPLGYGVGSSGTVCAAVYARYARGEDADLTTIRQRLASIESFFHGSSSGLDPIVSLRNSPMIADASGCQETTVNDRMLAHIFLLDSGQARRSSTIIPELRQRFETNTGWRELVRAEWMQPTEQLIQNMITNEYSDELEAPLRRLSNFQFEHLGQLIPGQFHQFKNESSFCLKLCGAGGGGFLIGYAFDR
ncbi:MAG: hypothetical protein AAFR97_15540, partial [Bacteroidota bacterium]